ERCKVVEENLVAGLFRLLVVDPLDLQQRKVPFPFLGRADLPGYDVTGAQVEAADLARGDVDVVRAGEIVVIRRPQKAETVREDLEDSLAVHEAVLFGLRPQDR